MERSSRALTILGCALMSAAALYFCLAVPWTATATAGLAAQPWPDGAEYLDMAVSLHRHGRARIHVGGEEHPSRYPAAFSLVTATCLAAGAPPAAAPYRVNLLAGALLLLLMAGWVAKHQGTLEAGVAALLLATFPTFVLLSRSPLSELSASVLVLGGAGFLYSYSGATAAQGASARGALVQGASAQGALGAALLGLSTSFRLSNVLLAPLLAAALLARKGDRWETKARQACVLGAAMALGMLPLFFGNWILLGHPLETGYGYWIPQWSADQAFDLDFLRPNLAYDLRELLQQESRFTTANLYGTGSYFGPTLVALIAWALWTLRADRRRLWSFAAACGSYYGAMKIYFFQDARLIFPIFLMAFPAAGRAVGLAWRGAAASKPRAAVGSVLLIATVAGVPGSGGFSDTAALLSVERPSSPGYRMLVQLPRMPIEAPRLILTDLNPPYVHAMTEPGTQVAPLYDDHLYRNNPK
ncbi:MAG: hypothetical protein AAF725_25980, partial [Acidobacteriota bacterium]